MNVITGLAHLKLFKVTFLGEGNVKVKQIQWNVCSIIYHRYAKYKEDKPNGYWNITGKHTSWGFVTGWNGPLKCCMKFTIYFFSFFNKLVDFI